MGSQSHKDKLDQALVSLVLDHARRIVAHPTRPTEKRVLTYPNYPFGEVALEESIEANPFLDYCQDLHVEKNEEKSFTCVAIVDGSSSMSGEKHLLASIAMAVMLLEVPSGDTALTVFSSHATEVKRLGSEEPPETTVLRFLRVAPRGFTNIALGLEKGAVQFGYRKGRGRRVGILVSDGRSTEGGDPLEIARQFDFLVVLHLDGPGSHVDASREIAQKGNGTCLEVGNFSELPRRVYDALKLIARR